MVAARTKPAALKRLEGNRGKRKIPDEVIAPGHLPPAPTHLSDSQKARWDDLIRSIPPELLAAADEAAVERAAVCWDAYREVTMRINEGEPMTSLNAGGTPVINPVWTLRIRLEKQMTQSALELGLSPVARARITKPEPVSSDPYELLAGPTGLAWSNSKRQ